MSNEPAISVRHYLAGGQESGGGIGRLVGYIVDAAPLTQSHLVTDTRGPAWTPARSLPRFALTLATMVWDRFASSGRIHHIHVAGRGSTIRKLVLAKLARTLGCIHVLHLHDNDYANDFGKRSSSQKKLVRRMFRGTDGTIVLGGRDRDTVVKHLGADPSRVIVLHNCAADPGQSRPPDAAVPTILFLGTLGPRKGVPELLAAFANPALGRLRWRAVLAGDGPVDLYRREAARLGISARVEMTGWLCREETQALLATADIVVLPSHAEGMAMAVIEGLAHGRPVLTTRVGAHEEAIEDGVNGVFVPVGDAESLAAALAHLIADPETRKRLGAAARSRFLEHFSMTAYMGGLGSLYASLAPASSRLVEQRTT